MTKYQNYGIKLYIPLEDLNKYIHEHVEEAYQDLTFIPSKVEVNEMDFGIEINLLSVNPIESDGRRYKLELDKLLKENNNERMD